MLRLTNIFQRKVTVRQVLVSKTLITQSDGFTSFDLVFRAIFFSLYLHKRKDPSFSIMFL